MGSSARAVGASAVAGTVSDYYSLAWLRLGLRMCLAQPLLQLTALRRAAEPRLTSVIVQLAAVVLLAAPACEA